VPGEAEIVRGIIANMAEGATLYAEAQRLNDKGIPSPGRRYRGKPRKHGVSWIHSTLARIVRKSAYSGVHRVRIVRDGQEEIIERPLPAIVEPPLQQKAIARLAENKQYSGGNRVRNYLLRGLIVCDRCGVNYVGFPAKTGHYRYHKYVCTRWKKRYERRAMELDCPRVSGNWLERIVWADVKRFLSDPGEVLERVRAQLESEHDHADLEERRASLRKKLAAVEEEKARLIRSYAKGTLSEAELEITLPDVRNRIENLRLLIESVESDLAAREQDRLAAQNTKAWLRKLADNLEEVDGDTPAAFERRRELVRLLVQRITVGRDENGRRSPTALRRRAKALLNLVYRTPRSSKRCRYRVFRLRVSGYRSLLIPEACNLIPNLERPLPDEPVLEDVEVRCFVAGAFEPADDVGYGLVGSGHAVGQGASDLVDDLAGGRGVLVEHLQKTVPVYAMRLDGGYGLDAGGGPGLGEEAHLAHDCGRLDVGEVLAASGEHPFGYLDGPGGDHIQPLLRPAFLEDGLTRLEARRLKQLLQLLALLVVQVPEERHVSQARRPLHP
jgi:hypothetical protein